MSEYYENGNFPGDETAGNNDPSSVYTYIPTDPVYPETGRKPERKRKKKGSGSIWKKIGVFLLCGVILGGTGAGAFIGVMKLSGYEDKMERAVDALNQAKTAKVEQAETRPTSAGNDNGGDTSVADVAENAMPSIVAITNTQVYQANDWSFFFGGGSQEVTGSGSGIIIGQNDTELLILTNYHVIAGSTSLKVTFTDGTSVDAMVKGTAENNDLAVLAIPLDSMSEETLGAIKIATLGDSDNLRVGDEVIAIGNALGYGQSLTYGRVSALSRDVTIDNNTMTLLQTDAAINPGNSGGALLNMKGEVIGINSAKYTGEDVEGMGFAIPVSEAQDIIDDLMLRTTRTEVAEEDASYLGIEMTAIDAGDAQRYNMPEGILVYSVVEGGPAEAAGLMERDIITALEGTGVSTQDELKTQLSYYSGGTTVELTIQRLVNGKYEEQKISVTLGYKRDYQQSQPESENAEQETQEAPNGGFWLPGFN